MGRKVAFSRCNRECSLQRNLIPWNVGRGLQRALSAELTGSEIKAIQCKDSSNTQTTHLGS
jgi:hypothetical protein